jgi:hypothetical protein
VVCLSTEIEQGNVEYKYRLTGCITNENRRHQLVSFAEMTGHRLLLQQDP